MPNLLSGGVHHFEACARLPWLSGRPGGARCSGLSGVAFRPLRSCWNVVHPGRESVKSRAEVADKGVYPFEICLCAGLLKKLVGFVGVGGENGGYGTKHEEQRKREIIVLFLVSVQGDSFFLFFANKEGNVQRRGPVG